MYVQLPLNAAPLAFAIDASLEWKRSRPIDNLNRNYFNVMRGHTCVATVYYNLLLRQITGIQTKVGDTRVCNRLLRVQGRLERAIQHSLREGPVTDILSDFGRARPGMVALFRASERDEWAHELDGSGDSDDDEDDRLVWFGKVVARRQNKLQMQWFKVVGTEAHLTAETDWFTRKGFLACLAPEASARAYDALLALADASDL